MSQSYLLEDRPPMWWLESSDADSTQDGDITSDGDVLRLGSHAVRLDDIASYKLEEVVERDGDRFLINSVIFSVLGAIFLIGALQFGWLERVLIGFVFLVILGMTSLTEIFRFDQKRHLQLTVFTRQGRRVNFTSTDSRDIDRLMGFLRHSL